MECIIIILDLLLTVIAYLSFPAIYRLKKGRIPAKKATRMSLINSIVCAVVIEALQTFLIFADDPEYRPNFLPAILYFGIAKAILQEKNTEKRKPK
ncbi:MAG: hypothetical protein ACI3XQ_08275 [Eubacteriales bacterium]